MILPGSVILMARYTLWVRKARSVRHCSITAWPPVCLLEPSGGRGHAIGCIIYPLRPDRIGPETTSRLTFCATQQTLCTSCHFKTGEFADKSRASILTHDGMECTNCHTPHGSENARYLKSTDVDLCTGCHERAHSSSHPIGPDVIDPRTGEPLTCLSCHKLHGADFEPYLPLSQEVDLCIQCHKR